MRSKKGNKIIAEIRDLRQRCALADMTFAPIPSEHKEAMAKEMEHKLALWWDSWIAPRLDELEKLS